MKQYLLLLLVLPFLLGCKSSTLYTMNSLPDEQLTFGSGGGFSGATTTFILLKNGQVFKRESLTQKTQEIAMTGAGKAKSLYKRAIKLGLDTLQIKEPGNLYYFIGLKTEGVDNQITWGSGDYDLSADLEAFYKDLQQVTKVTK